MDTALRFLDRKAVVALLTISWRWNLVDVHQASSYGKSHQLGAGVHIQLAHDALTVTGDRLRADLQRFSNLDAGHALSNAFQYL